MYLKLFISDFECALINALKSVFPSVAHKGCFFHFAQAIHRHMCQLGFKRGL